MTPGNNDTSSDREHAFLEDLYRQLADRLATRYAVDYDTDASRARFMTWLTAHTTEPKTAAIQQSPTQNRHAGSSETQATIRVFLLDDHEVVRTGLKDLLASEDGIEVVGEAASASTALARMPALRPDVALLDVRLPDGDGVLVCREIRSILPGTACLMLTGYDDDRALVGAVMAGAAGYVSKQATAQDLVQAIRTVASGQSALSPDAAQKIMARVRDEAGKADPLAALSNQEKRVLDLVCEGLTNRQIAERMFLPAKAVKTHVASLLDKLGMQRSQAAAFAIHRAGHSNE